MGKRSSSSSCVSHLLVSPPFPPPPEREKNVDLLLYLPFGAWKSYSLKPLDIEIMKRLGSRVNLIPVIAKADTLTQKDLKVFKQKVRVID